MAARGYEFYLRVMNVSLTSERCDVLIILQILMKFPHKTQFFKNSFKIVQCKWSPIAKCLSQKCYETRI